MTLDRFFRSRTWLVVSLLLPALLASAGGVWLAYVIASQRAEILRLRAQVAACEGASHE